MAEEIADHPILLDIVNRQFFVLGEKGDQRHDLYRKVKKTKKGSKKNGLLQEKDLQESQRSEQRNHEEQN